MSRPIRFDQRVALVTGAGNGLGAEYARELAARGCHVIVNDLGVTTAGGGRDASPADRVVSAIRDSGGSAEADYCDVGDADAVRSMVNGIVARHDRLDVLICNAGFLRDRTFAKSEVRDLEAVIRVHLLGTIYCCHAVWPFMMSKGYGRIVMTTSGSGLFGNFGQSAYCAAKAGIVGLMQGLKLEGPRHGIHVNVIAPAAATRLASGVLEDRIKALLPLAPVASGTVLLASEQAPNGVTLSAGGGYFSTVALREGGGVRLGLAATVEDIADCWASVSSFEKALAFTDVMQEMQHIYGTGSAAGLSPFTSLPISEKP